MTHHTHHEESLWPALTLIVVGGSAGTLARHLVESAWPASSSGVPWATLGINVGGSFLLAVLLGVLARTGDDVGARKAARLALGTGVLGGFTTYSTLAVETLHRAPDSPWLAAGYALLSVVAGGAAAGVGYLLTRPPHEAVTP